MLHFERLNAGRRVSARCRVLGSHVHVIQEFLTQFWLLLGSVFGFPHGFMDHSADRLASKQSNPIALGGAEKKASRRFAFPHDLENDLVYEHGAP